MKPANWTAVLAAALLWAAAPAIAQQTESPAPEDEGEAGQAGEADEGGGEDAAGEQVDMTEEVIFERQTGLYFEGRGGVFFTFGGSRGYSNGEPFFGFEVGYDFTDWFSLQISYAQGYQAANPIKDPLACGAGEDCSGYHMDFGLTFFNVSADFDLVGGRRWALEARVGGGVALIEPSAEPGQAPVDGDLFAGVRGEYYTLLKHFSLGAEVDYYIIVPTMINSMAITMSVLYNF